MSEPPRPIDAPVGLLGLVGSLRVGSVNGAIARAAVDETADSAATDLLLHSLADLPMYSGDEEEAGPPAPVTALQEAAAAADGIVFFSPEYNGSFPAVTKNAFDWLSRPPRAWSDKAVTMITASPGPRAGLGIRTHFSAIVERQPVRGFETLGLGTYGDRLVEGRPNAETIQELADFLERFAHFCRTAEE